MLTEKDLEIFNAMPTFADGRKRLIEMTTIKHENNWQDVATPYDIAGEMIDLVKHDNTKYVVMFSLEFLEVMVMEKGISADDILFISDFDIEGDTAEKLYGVTHAVINKNDVMVNGKFTFDKFTKVVNIFTLPLISNQEEINNSEINMKFNKLAVLGNPPYQMTNMSPLYHFFVESVIDNLNPDYFSMIIPSRWMIGGKGLDKHRERMMNDTRMKKIVHFGGSSEIFSTVEIKGGVNYFLFEKDYSGECEFVNGNTSSKRFLNSHDIILLDNNAFTILEKITNITSMFINQSCYSTNPFGVATNYNNWVESDCDNAIVCYASGKSLHKINFSDFSDSNNIIGKYKVCMSEANNGATTEDKNGMKRMIGDIFIVTPNEICTQTYIVVNSFESMKEAENFISYMKTKLFRFMLSLRVLTQHINKEKFTWVPDQLDYSMPWNDVELYKKYNLTRQEIAYIESKIKAI